MTGETKTKKTKNAMRDTQSQFLIEICASSHLRSASLCRTEMRIRQDGDERIVRKAAGGEHKCTPILWRNVKPDNEQLTTEHRQLPLFVVRGSWIVVMSQEAQALGEGWLGYSAAWAPKMLRSEGGHGSCFTIYHHNTEIAQSQCVLAEDLKVWQLYISVVR